MWHFIFAKDHVLYHFSSTGKLNHNFFTVSNFNFHLFADQVEEGKRVSF